MNEKEILALEDKRFGAMIARDFKALEAMLHGDLLYTHSSGVTDEGDLAAAPPTEAATVEI
jgi:hypothetical protein